MLLKSPLISLIQVVKRTLGIIRIIPKKNETKHAWISIFAVQHHSIKPTEYTIKHIQVNIVQKYVDEILLCSGKNLLWLKSQKGVCFCVFLICNLTFSSDGLIIKYLSIIK